MKKHSIRAAVKPLGRRNKNSVEVEKERQWRRKKQRERNRIEGAIGYGKTNFHLGLIRAKLPKQKNRGLKWDF
ncbi:transposase [candidate division KSB1 bacterium]|nr:transposase [candidate division KSB1 bacterium]